MNGFTRMIEAKKRELPLRAHVYRAAVSLGTDEWTDGRTNQGRDRVRRQSIPRGEYLANDSQSDER